ncbi:hypothetical protein NBRC116494_33420 [Aurantivibrio plasticivorans]
MSITPSVGIKKLLPVSLAASIACLLTACSGHEETTVTTNHADSTLAQVSMAQETGDTAMTFSPRLEEPRIPPLPVEGRTPEQIEMLNNRPDFNLYKTLAHHVELYDRWTPLGRVLLNASTLPARDREIIMLRMGWLCQAEYEWSQHARIATNDVGMSYEEILKIASDPNAESWTDFEKTLMDMVDELRYDGMVSDATWQKLSVNYSQQEIIDAIFTAAQYQLVSMVLNSTGIQLDPVLEHTLPTEFEMPALATTIGNVRLSTPRLKPLTLEEMTDEQRDIIKPHVREDGSIPNIYATMIHHPALFGPRYTFGSYIMSQTSLPPQARELLIMRTGWLLNAEYEWAHHEPIAKAAGLSDEDITRIALGPNASGWSDEHRAVLNAADDLRREAFITDDTFSQLTKFYNTQQIMELVFTVGGYSMTAFAINSLGIQVEEGYPRFPSIKEG